MNFKMWLSKLPFISCYLYSSFAVPNDNCDIFSPHCQHKDTLSSFNSNLWSKADGWSNGFPFINRWSEKAISFQQKKMRITLSKTKRHSDGLHYQSGELRSNRFYGYGCFDIEMKPIATSGVVSSFFLFAGPYDRNRASNGQHNEIDIEFLGNNTNLLQVNFWTNDDDYLNDHATLIYLDFDASLDFHHYRIVWAPNYIQWFVDHQLVHQVFNDYRDPIPSASDSQLKVMTNVWLTSPDISQWAGIFQPNSQQLSAEYKNFSFQPINDCK